MQKLFNTQAGLRIEQSADCAIKTIPMHIKEISGILSPIVTRNILNRIRAYLHTRRIIAIIIGFVLAVIIILPLQSLTTQSILKKRSKLL